ncbi:hypothetical protein GYA93_06740 [Gordonia desulfuricans]|uniref:Uncharacterized protein n=1 Tax=Gordonia desulfuricans TaxID=89051 RepID=A0A7K3LM08_9ACTN|nr:hypothetical protein [Gordonia desulfuricans]NDK89280.1 hypothetical protein [Gordonia desulfuricans]
MPSTVRNYAAGAIDGDITELIHQRAAPEEIDKTDLPDSNRGSTFREVVKGVAPVNRSEPPEQWTAGLMAGHRFIHLSVHVIGV